MSGLRPGDTVLDFEAHAEQWLNTTIGGVGAEGLYRNKVTSLASLLRQVFESGEAQARTRRPLDGVGRLSPSDVFSERNEAAVGGLRPSDDDLYDLLRRALDEIADMRRAAASDAERDLIDGIYNRVAALRACPRPADPDVADLDRALVWLRAQLPGRCLDTRHPEVRSLAREFAAVRFEIK